MMRADFKKTEHTYRGYHIKGRQVRTQGEYVLGGRHYVEGGIKRNYLIVKDNRQYYSGCIISSLKEAKEIVDDLIKRNEVK
jgi:hypothetical protein